MKVYGFYSYELLVILILYGTVSGKTVINKRNSKESDAANNDVPYNSGVKYSEKSTMYRTNSNKRQSEEEDESASPSASVPFKVPRINTLGTHCYDVPSSKRSAENDYDNRNNVYNKIQGNFKKRNSPYGIVYNQGKPIGILEPISQVYEYSNFKEAERVPEEIIKEPLKKRETDAVESKHDLKSHASSVSGGKYASILASFKIGNRMKMRPLTEEVALQNNLEKKRERAYYKRSLPEEKDITVFPLKKKEIVTSKNKRELSDKNLIEIEDNLKSIMNDLGLSSENNNINKRELLNSTKRETFAEDEDLEKGLNKIGLTKESHTLRDKKENCPGKTNDKEVTKRSISKNYRKGNEIPSSDDTNIEGEIISKKYKKVNPSKIVDLRSEGEAFIRQKRQQSKQSSDDIVKGLEASGDLTVSGNKSPLASSSNSAITEPNETQQISQHKMQHNSDRDERREDSEYEKRLQRNIQSKISEIKEQVKREISALKQSKESKHAAAKEIKKDIKKEAKPIEKKKRDNEVVNQAPDEKKAVDAEKKVPKENEVEKKKRADVVEKKVTEPDKIATPIEKKAVRSKRNLMDADTSNIDPGINLEDKLDPHERRRRDTSSDNWDGNNDVDEVKEARVTWHEINEEDSQSDKNKREGPADSFAVQKNNPVAHDPKLFQFEPRAKRAIDNDKKIKDDKQKAKVITENKVKVDTKRDSSNTGTIDKISKVVASSENMKTKIVKKRSSNDDKQIIKANGEESNSNFWDVQNQNVAKTGLTQTSHAIVSRSLETKNVPAAVEKQPILKQAVVNTKGEVKRSNSNNSQTHKQDLIKLITESDLLARSVSKKQRDARSGEQPNIEVELHSGPSAASAKEVARSHDLKKSTDTSSFQRDYADSKLTPDRKSLEQTAKFTIVDNQMKVADDQNQQPVNEKRSIKQKKVVHDKAKSDESKLTKDAKLTPNAKFEDVKLVQAKLNEDKAIMIENAAMLNAENKMTEEKIKGEESTPVAAKVDAKLTEDKAAEMLTPNGETKLTEDKIDANMITNENQNSVASADESNLENDEVEFADKTKPSEDKVNEDEMDKSKVIDEHDENSQLASVAELENSVKRKRSVDESKAARKIVDENLSHEGSNERVNRKERTLEPSVSLDDMQRFDSANSMKRRRRRQAGYYNRRKRDDLEDNSNMQFRSYRGDEDEADDESDEFDDDNFDDRTSNYIRKRAIGYGNQVNEYDQFDDDYEPVAANVEYRNGAQRLNKRNSIARNYINDMNSDVYENPNNYLYERSSGDRKKRQTFQDIASLHGGGPMARHLAAIRERNRQPLDNNYRMKRLEKMNRQSKDQSIAGLSESDIFGGLPQSYEGELNRFKRVKRDKFT